MEGASLRGLWISGCSRTPCVGSFTTAVQEPNKQGCGCGPGGSLWLQALHTGGGGGGPQLVRVPLLDTVEVATPNIGSISANPMSVLGGTSQGLAAPLAKV